MLSLLWTILLAVPPSQASTLAQRLDIPANTIKVADTVRFNGRAIATWVLYEQQQKSYGALVPHAGRPIRMGRVDRFEPGRIFDLEQPGPLPLNLGHIGSMRSTARQPVWVVITETRRVVTPSPKRRLRRDGVASEDTLHLFRLPDLKRIARLPYKARSGDGFGGFDVSGWTVVHEGGSVSLTASRQDHLPAHRARCRRPPAVPVRYHLEHGSFRNGPRVPTVRCGQSPRLPTPKR